MSQDALAAKIDVSYQQIQKYERGVDRIAASRLAEIAQVLAVEFGEFFDEQKIHASQEIIDARKYTDIILALEEIASIPAKREIARFIKRIAGHL